jgi:hypothetical protein
MEIIKESDFLSKSYNLGFYYIFKNRNYYSLCKCESFLPFILKSFPRKFSTFNEANTFFENNYKKIFYERLIPDLLVESD